MRTVGKWLLLTVEPGTITARVQGLDLIDGEATLALPAGRAVRFQKTANRVWTTIAVNYDSFARDEARKS